MAIASVGFIVLKDSVLLLLLLLLLLYTRRQFYIKLITGMEFLLTMRVNSKANNNACCF